jgi:hypothetical protein
LLVFAALVSPLMGLYGASFCVILALRKPERPRAPILSGVFLTTVMPSRPEAPVWNEVSHSFYYLSHWAWYELLGVVAPIIILYVFSRMRKHESTSFRLVSGRLALFGALFALFSLVLEAPALEQVLAIQPMRSFHIVYVLLFLFFGGLIGETFLKNKPLRWILFFLPLCLAMFVSQLNHLPASDHIEWPWMKPRNQWVQAFQWVRENTPKNAYFVLDPYYMARDGEDYHGFRALAERSATADLVKDPAVVSVLVSANKLMADNFEDKSVVVKIWREQVAALRDWKNFGGQDFHRLKEQFGVDWVVIEKPGVSGLACPYENDAVKVCHVD